jgi:hypothetical protein
MALTNFKTQQQEPDVDTNRCSVEGCTNIWAVHISGEKPKCSHHQWLNSGKAKPAPILANYPKKVKTVKVWYDEVEF